MAYKSRTNSYKYECDLAHSFVRNIYVNHLHARDQCYFEDVLCTGGGVSHGDIEGSVDAECHQPHVTFWLLVIAIIWHINVGENSMEVKTSFLTCRKKINTYYKY